jgi:hypothetical protein
LHTVSRLAENGARRLTGMPLHSYAVAVVEILGMPDTVRPAQAPPLIINIWAAVLIALAAGVAGGLAIAALRSCRRPPGVSVKDELCKLSAQRSGTGRARPAGKLRRWVSRDLVGSGRRRDAVPGSVPCKP